MNIFHYISLIIGIPSATVLFFAFLNYRNATRGEREYRRKIRQFKQDHERHMQSLKQRMQDYKRGR